MALSGIIFKYSLLILGCAIVIGIECSAVPPKASDSGDCQTDDDCNSEATTTRECIQAFKNMTTNCECLKEYYCRKSDGPCPLRCYPKKI